MRRTQCAGCGGYFSSTAEFEAHRTGDYGRTPSQRRCMTAAELAAAGFTSEPRCITDERGRPTRQVWFRAAVRARVLEFERRKAAKGTSARPKPQSA